MATYYSQGDGAWSTLTNWDTNAGGGGSDPASVADMDDDSFIIQAGHDIEFDVDMSGFTNGIAGLTITSHATDPGMLYCKYSGDGTYYLKIKTGVNIIGTNAAAKGRILANSDGVWANTTALPNGRKFTIEFAGTSAGYIDLTYLDIRLFCTTPTYKSIETYGSKYTTTVDAGTDVFTATGSGFSANTEIKFKSSGALPAPLLANVHYFAVNVSGDTFKVAYNSGGTAIDITDTGSGTIECYTGYASGSSTINVLTDVTGDIWSTTDGIDWVYLVDEDWASTTDTQKMQMDTINAGSLVMKTTVTNAKKPGARIVVLHRNIVLKTNSTSSSASIIYGNSRPGATSTSYFTDVINAEIFNVTAGSSYSSGFSYTGWNVTIGSGACFHDLARCFNSGNGGFINAAIFVGCAIIGTGTFFYIDGAEIYGVSNYCFSGVFKATGMLVIGVNSFTSAVVGKKSIYIKNSTIIGAYVLNATGNPDYIDCNIYASSYMNGSASGANFQGGAIQIFTGITPTGGLFEGSFINVKNLYSPAIGRTSSNWSSRIVTSALNLVDGAEYIYGTLGDVTKTAINAGGDAPTQNPDGAASGYCIEVSNLQSVLDLYGQYFPIRVFDHKIWLAAGTYTITYKCQTTMGTSGGAAIAAGTLILTARYISASSPRTLAEAVENSTAILGRTSATDWSQSIHVHVTTALDGWVELWMDFYEYEANDELYVWPVPTIA